MGKPTFTWIRATFSKVSKWLGITSLSDGLRVIIFEALITFLWWFISKLINIELVKEIGYLVVFVAGIFALAWYMPRMALVRVGANAHSTSSKPIKPQPKLMYDNILWMYKGVDQYGDAHVTDPLCPKDYTTLRIRRLDDTTSVRYDADISDSSYDWKLYCPACNAQYILGEKKKRLGDSRDEVCNIFEGKKRLGELG